MKILLTGKTGQVGYELERSLQGVGEIIALDRSQMDLANADQIRQVISAVKPDLIINPAAYTAVDLAESETELAMQINGIAPGVIAEEAKKIGATMIHYSTDYVFDGSKRGANGDLIPYTEDDLPNPINVYGKTKLAGEQAIIASGCKHIIFRTSWVYSSHGKNFLLTMLRLAKERDELKVIDDQWGGPTWAGWIADITAQLIRQFFTSFPCMQILPMTGIYNLVNSGYTTWYRFARQIFIEMAVQADKNKKNIPRVLPISALEYPLPAPRPSNSTLSMAKLQSLLPNTFIAEWQQSLKDCLVANTYG